MPRATRAMLSDFYQATRPWAPSDFSDASSNGDERPWIVRNLEQSRAEDDEYGEDSVQILGVNAVGYEDSISDITEGNTLPLLQDTEPVDAWGAWYADWRDLVIIDESNAWVGLFNLTTHDLADASNLTDVREMVDDALATQ